MPKTTDQTSAALAREYGDRDQLLRRTFLVDDELVHEEWSEPVQFRFEREESGRLVLVMRRV